MLLPTLAKEQTMTAPALLAPFILARGPGERWELAWDSAWDRPDELRAAAINGALHPSPGERTTLEPLSMRLYTGAP